MIFKFKEDQQYSNEINIDFDDISSKSIYCLYYKQYNVAVNCILIEKLDSMIAYGDNEKEVIDYRNELVENKKYIPVHLYIKNIPNIVSYKCQ